MAQIRAVSDADCPNAQEAWYNGMRPVCIASMALSFLQVPTSPSV